MGESRITPSGIINDAVSMIGKMNDSSFPIDVFPNKIRNIILYLQTVVTQYFVNNKSEIWS